MSDVQKSAKALLNSAKVELSTGSKSFGNVSYDAYKYYNKNGSFDGYNAKNEDEKKSIQALNDYEKQMREPENLGQGILHGLGYAAEKAGAGAVDFISDMGNYLLAGGATVLRPFTWGSWNEGLQNYASTQLNAKTFGDVWSESAESRYRVPDWYRQYIGTTAQAAGALAVPMAVEAMTGGLAPTEGYTAAQLAKISATASKATNTSLAANFATKLVKAPKLSEVVFGLGATASATKEAYQQSGNLRTSFSYGVLNGLGEVATERLFGGFGGTGIGADELIDIHKYASKIPLIGRLASTKYGAKVLDIAFEGVEEGIMALADPSMQKLTFNSNAKLGDLYKNTGLGESFLQGILLSSVMNASTATLNKGISVANKSRAIKSLNQSAEELNATLPSGVARFKPLNSTATVEQINERNSELQRVAAIYEINNSISGINALFKNDADKLQPLTYDATIEEIQQRQWEMSVFASGYADLMVEELVKNNPEAFKDIKKTDSAEPTTAEETTVVETPAVEDNAIAETPVATEQRNTFTEELDEIASTEMPTVSVGDAFIDSKTNNVLKVVGRDETTTTIEITTPDGKKEVITRPNHGADTLAVDEKYRKVETSIGTGTTSATTEGKSLLDTDENLRSVYNALISEKLSTSTINKIVNTPVLKKAFGQLTGVKIEGTKAEQRAIVRNFHNNAQNIANLKAKYDNDTKNNVVLSEGLNTADETTSATKETVTEEEISVVVDAMKDTLKEGAEEGIYAGMPADLEKSLDTFAKQLIKAYKRLGTIGRIAECFSDGGKKVISAIESVLTKSNLTNGLDNSLDSGTAQKTGEVLQNQSEGDTIEEKTTAKAVPDADKSRTVAYTNDNEKVDLVFRVVSVDDLVVSNGLDGKVNPDYPQTLQPRDRSRTSSQSQIRQIAANLNPARLAESTSVSEGSPIVGFDNVVESGNGRTLAIKLAYENGTADEYRNYIISNADKYGLDVSKLPEKPVLVRERITEVDRREFTRKANESSIGSLSATEQAKVDAEKLTEDVLNLLVANDDGVINTSDNHDFISAVISKVFKNEDLNNVVNAEGRLSARGLERITNAIFYKAYGDVSLSARLSESLDNDMKNATKVLLNIAPRIVSIKNGISSEVMYGFDFSTDIVNAIKLFEKCRNDNTTLENHAAQESLFEKEPMLVMAMAYVFETKNRGAKQATDFYNLLLDTVEELGNPKQISLDIIETFQTKEEIFNATVEKFNNRVEPKNAITIPENILESESGIGREDDRRGIDEVSGDEPGKNEKTENAVGVQQDNRRSEETRVVADDEQLRQKSESNARQSEVEREDNGNERRSNSVSENSGRGNNGSTRKQTGRFSYFERKNKGKNATERQNFARELIQRGHTEEVTEKIGKHTYKYTLVKPEYYNDDMLSMIEEAKKKGVELGFFIGNAKVNFDSKDAFLIDGIKISGSKVLVQYDEHISPQKLFKHELGHAKWKTGEWQRIKDTILNSLSETDKENILSQDRYKRYMEMYKKDKNREDIVLEEFVCDVMSGMNNYTAKYADVVAEYWYGNESVDSYSVAEYTESIDAGGENTERYSFAGEKADTADLSKLDEAKIMLKQGLAKEDILKQTGWFKGADGKWRFEIDDSNSKFSFEKLKQETTLENVWQNDDVYNAYPFLKSIKIKAKNFGDKSKTYGEYDASTNTISISDEIFDADMMKNFRNEYEQTIIHEVQHVIQFYEGFELGGNSNEMIGYLRMMARDYLVNAADNKLQRILASGSIANLNKYVDDFIVSQFGAKDIEDASKKAYRRLHGEKEAFASEKRMLLTAEERREIYPNYGKGAILRNEIEGRNINDRVSATSERTPESEFISYLYSDSRRRMGEKSEVGEELRASRISEAKDSEGNTLTEGQQEYFKDSKVRDDNGNLLVMYQGSANDFTVFDRKKSNYANLYGRGFYFTQSENHASQYGKTRAYYLNIKHPVSTTETTITKSQLRKFLQAVAENEDYGFENYGYGATVDSVLQSTYGKSDFLMLNDVSQTAIGDLVEAVELFNEVNGTDYDGIMLSTETVTFNSEQAKLTSNENPTSDPDIRFSLAEPVEETKNLVAVHNMQVSELERTLDLGGLPMPSIAIIKAQSGHSEYGDVSLVFDKQTIDPKASKSNKVYGGDAWTPTYPTIEYKPNTKVAKKISDKYYELSRKFGYDESRPLYNYVYDLERKLNSNKGETEMINELYDDTEMMQLYLLDSGKGKVDTINKETRTELTDAEVEMCEFFIKELGADVVDEVKWDGNSSPIAYRKNYMSKYEDAIREAYKKLLSEEYQFTEEQVQNVLDSTKAVNYLNFVRDAQKYRENGRVTIKTEADYEATQKAIKDAAGEDYRKWVDSLFKGIEEKSGIRNNADYFTNSGNRRSWEALHWENNLENVVKVMKSQNDVGSAAIFTGHGIWGVAAKNYRSIEEIKADADRLKKLPEEEYNKIKESFGERLHEIAYSIMSKSERNPFIAEDNAMECIIEAVRNSKTKSGILKNLKEYQQLTVTETTVDDIISLVNDISNMPTEYFEAKPQRAVELNEIATAIIPDNTSQTTKERLDDMGIKYLEYESGNEDARLEALNSLEDVRFSLADNSYAPTFYSQMGKTIDEMKQDKIGANSVIPYLKGRGVKDEEIKWSGIESFLDGKKSVTKAELQEFVANNQLQIEETVLDSGDVATLERQEDGSNDYYVMRGGKIYDSLNWDSSAHVWVSDAYGFYFDSIPRIKSYYGVGEGGTRWGDYKLDGGENYREIIFKMPNSDYSNQSMRTHWGEDAKGILAHARLQDFDVDGKKMLFIEEIQSDWHNEGMSRGYESKLSINEQKTVMELTEKRTRLFNELRDVLEEIRKTAESAEKQNLSAYEQGQLTAPLWEKAHNLREEERALLEESQKIEGTGNVPDAPFRNNYHEFVLKNIIRMAAEQGYDSIGWTTADIQSERWSDKYAEGYRIEYDQEIPKFLNKYGKKWEAKVGKTEIGKEDGGWYEVEGTTVWSMPITDSMKESVLYEGQVRYSLATDGILDLEDLWTDAIETYGTIPKGEIPARDVDVPKKISKKDVVSRFARTMIEAGVTPDETVSEFEKAILDGTMTHEVITDKRAREKAVQLIKHLGFEDALERWSVLSDASKVGKNELALGMELYNQCITNKDVHNAMKIAAELVTEATRAGQTLQAARMLKRMTPDGQLYYLEKSIQKMNEEFKEKLGDKYKDIELDESLMEEFLTQEDETKRNEAYDKICQNIADQIPATMLDKWNSWRYLAMLGNPRTHLRNIFGNAVFIPSLKLKNYIGAVLEKVARVNTADRTKSLLKNKEAVKFAKSDVEEMIKVLQGENAKYAVTSDIQSKRTIFKTRFLEKLRLKNFDFLEREDMWFLKHHYTDALARLITARKIDVDSITPEMLEKVRAYAVKEAQAATYRDANALAEGLNRLQRNLEHSNKRIIRATGILVEGVMPFKKTPMNIAKQGLNYSPLGILNGVYKSLTKLRKGDLTVTEVIDDLSKGLSGTMVMMLGYFLASMGYLGGDEDKSKKEKEFDKMVGEQSYSLNIGDDCSYTIDWMTPSNLALFIGVKLYDFTKDDFQIADVFDALSTVTEPLLELSVFSGLNGVIESAQYSDSEALITIGSEMITSYLMQGLPTLGGQISRMVDESKREYYYADRNSDIPQGLQRLIGQASSKIPFASYLFQPAIDEWGREETYGSVAERILENTVSPGYYAEKNYTMVDKKLKELYDKTGDNAVFPVIQQKKYTEDGVDYYMSAKDYTEAKKLRGQKSFELVSELFADGMSVKLKNKETNKYEQKRYSQMSDDEKVRAIKKCYEDAGDYAKEEMLEKVKRKSKSK